MAKRTANSRRTASRANDKPKTNSQQKGLSEEAPVGRVESPSSNPGMDPDQNLPPRFAWKQRFRRQKLAKEVLNASHLSAGSPPDYTKVSSASGTASPLARLKETIKEQETLIEFVRLLATDHELILNLLPSEERLNRWMQWFESIEERIEIRDMENDRLRHENALLQEKTERLKEDFRRLAEEQGEITRRLEGRLPKYKRRMDPCGRPFAEWRRKPSSAEHLPESIDTTTAEPLVQRKRYTIMSPVDPETSECGSSEATLIYVDEHSNKRRGMKRKREGDLDGETGSVNSEPTGDESSQEHINDSAACSPPVKVIRIGKNDPFSCGDVDTRCIVCDKTAETADCLDR